MEELKGNKKKSILFQKIHIYVKRKKEKKKRILSRQIGKKLIKLCGGKNYIKK